MMQPLPIDPAVPEIVAALKKGRALVLSAAPGAGKSTRVPPALLEYGPVILLQPRRVAARAVARRIADERGWELGREIGWQIRFERNFSRATRLLVATEGILTARMQSDPLLTEFGVVILDEFHERSIHTDMAVALARQAMLARDDLRLVIMSATIDSNAISQFLGEAPLIEVPGREFPIEVDYRPGAEVGETVLETLPRSEGDLLCFLPGMREIDRAAATIGSRPDIALHRLHSSVDAAEQDRALAMSSRRKVILATNIAETSLTVEGIRVVIDSGLHRVMRYDVTRGVDSLERERIPADSATQRAGRAGRTAPGKVIRLWDRRDHLAPAREPEIHRIDLAAPLLDVIAWGGDPRTFEWFERPRPERIDAAIELLELLGALHDRRLSPLGERLHRLPLHPRVARLLLAARDLDEAAFVAALLSEGTSVRGGEHRSTDSDLIDLAEISRRGLERTARELVRIVRGSGAGEGESSLLEATFAAWPDRVARRRAPGSDRLVLYSGHGAVQARESGVRSEFLVAVDSVVTQREGAPHALIRLASSVEREWLRPTRVALVHRFDPQSDAVRAVEESWYGEILLQQRPVAPEPAEAERILAEEVAKREDEESALLLRRLRFASIEADLPAIFSAAVRGRTSLKGFRLREHLPWEVLQRMEREAPELLDVPSGRRVRLEYRDDGGVEASVKLQELFGLAETPRIGPRKVPVTFLLLAPSGRPVQTTRDLRSFWERTYPEVRKELRGRYPKHPWPDDPWTAEPTAKTKKKTN
jgi:ATP-dependent helicase HrpB